LPDINAKVLEKILNMVSWIQQNKQHEMTQKQIKELKEDFNKHQSETKDTVEKYMN
jgi:hypothetical protein